MRLTAKFFVRGGIFTNVVAEHRKKGWKPEPRVELTEFAFPIQHPRLIAMTPESRTQLDDEQLDRLEALLDDPEFDEAMRLDEIQGYLCAAHRRPAADPRGRLAGRDAGQRRRAEQRGRPRSRRNAAALFAEEALEAELAAGEPLCCCSTRRTTKRRRPSDYEPWCQAYLAGVDQAAKTGSNIEENERRGRGRTTWTNACSR
jgi:hypothetical protein